MKNKENQTGSQGYGSKNNERTGIEQNSYKPPGETTSEPPTGGSNVQSPEKDS